MPNQWTKYRQELERKRKLFERWREARPTLIALGINFPMPYELHGTYKVMPESTFFSLWAFQHQKALKEFVKVTGGDETDEIVIVDCANYLWNVDPKTVEKRLN